MHKFRKDNEINFILWVIQFEAQSNVMGIADDNSKWKNLLLYCADPVAFGAATGVIIWKQNVTYAKLKTLPNEKFCGTGLHGRTDSQRITQLQ